VDVLDSPKVDVLDSLSQSRELGKVQVPAEVPPGSDDVPVDLGDIKTEVKGR
jgi:hypothetical protein